MRAALSALQKGSNICIVSKSLLGKAHTVMAEGGIAASVANVDSKDNWEVHFSDTIIEGVYLGDWSMAETLAKEAPKRVYELERFGAIFDRTKNGKIMQRAFGGHTYRRLCHVGDKTGLEIIRTLEDKILHSNTEVFDEVYITKLFLEKGRFAGALGLEMRTGKFIVFNSKTLIMATGGCGRVYKITSNSWESTGDGLALAYKVGAKLMNMEMIQFHPTGMVWPPGVKGLLVTEGIRGDGGILLNNKNERFMLKYSPQKKELDARDIVARANYNEIKEGRGTKHGGVYLDISYKGKNFIKKKLPGMYSQFMEFAGIDITKQPMEVAPTVHYQMGGIKINPKTCQTDVEGIYAAGEVASGLHGANRLGGNSLADILVFGKIVGESAASYSKNNDILDIDKSSIDNEISRVSSFIRGKGYNPYDLIDELATAMGDYVGILRNNTDLQRAIDIIEGIKSKFKDVSVEGTIKYNHGLLGCLELSNMLIACEAIARSAIMRKESRGAHARTDFKQKSRKWKVNILCTYSQKAMRMSTSPVPEIPERFAEILKAEVYDDE